MNSSALNIFIRVIGRRIESGESIDNILESYPKLSEEEKQKILSIITGTEEKNEY